MSKFLLERFIFENLITESKKENLINDMMNSLLKNQLSKSNVYDYLRSSDQKFIKYSSNSKATKNMEKINKKYEEFCKSGKIKGSGNLEEDLKKLCDGNFIASKLNNFLSRYENIKGVGYSFPWLAIQMNSNFDKSISLDKNNNVVSERRHNLYFSIEHPDLSGKHFKLSAIKDYWSKLKDVAAGIGVICDKFNEENLDKEIEVYQFKFMYTSSSKKFTRYDTVFESFLFEPDRLKVYFGGVNRNTPNLSKIKKDLYNQIKQKIEEKGLVLANRKRSTEGYDVGGGSFGENVAYYTHEKILDLKKTNDSQLSTILQTNDKDAFIDLLDRHINIVEEWVKDPANASKVKK